MPRDYQDINPQAVVRNLASVLKHQDMDKLSKGAYRFLITHCGFIAHYNHRGFMATYRDDLPAFIDGFLSQHGMGWTTWLENTRSYLYDTSYRGILVADIVRDLIPIFEAARRPAVTRHKAQVLARKTQVLRALAEELGYELQRR